MIELHPRTIIRNTLALKLMNRSEAYKNRVFIQREAKLDSAHDFPCVAIYTNEEQQDSERASSFGKYRRKLSMQLQIFNRRAPDEVQPHQSIQGMPRQPVNYSLLAQDLDSICLDVERLIIDFIKRGSVEYNEQVVYVDNEIEINTEIQQSENGSVPYSCAIISFSVFYYINLNDCNTNYCAFTNAVIDIKPIVCDLKECK